MKPPVPYFGGKSRLADWIVGLMPEHRVYVEPFGGSAAVLLAKPRSRHEVLNDLDGNIVTFFRVLRDRPVELERACRLTPYARDEFTAADLTDPSIDDLERARRWWIRASQSFAKTGTTTGWATSILRNSNQARTAHNRCDRFADVAERLAGVTIEHRDAVDVITGYDDPDGLIYADPPYVVTTRSALKKRPAGDYACEFSTIEQHQALAQALRACSATVLLSGYASDLYAELYAGWSCVTRHVSRHTGNSRSSARKHTIEAVWCNRPLDEQLLLDGGAA
jgi:DNA adenine methylase